MSGVIELRSPIARGYVFSTDGGLTISSGTDEILLGPEFMVVVAVLEMRAKNLLATSHDGQKGMTEGLGAVLIVRDSIDHDPEMKVRAVPLGALNVSFPEIWHQFRQYRMESGLAPVPSVDENVSWQVMFGIRRILSVFQSSVKADPSIYRERIDRITVGSNPVFRATLDALIEIAVISVETNLYRLNLAKLAEFGVNYAAVRGTDFASKLKQLHAEVCKKAPVLALLRGDAT